MIYFGAQPKIRVVGPNAITRRPVNDGAVSGRTPGPKGGYLPPHGRFAGPLFTDLPRQARDRRDLVALPSSRTQRRRGWWILDVHWGANGFSGTA